ncbi:MAG: glycosyltransferase [Sphingobacteriales bacterium]|nr:glycosyltransferase [Sphingobacteriales bacterium]
MTNIPLLSVCIITYNHKNYIRQAIEGALMQETKFSYEIIIADDCSTDGTREILLEYKEKYPDLITLILQEKNVGAAKNYIDLLNAPASKYIAYVEGDDCWTDPDKLQIQVDFLENHAEFVGTFHDHSIIGDGTVTNLKLHEKGGYWTHTKDVFTIDDIIQYNPTQSISLVYRNVYKHNYPECTMSCPLQDWAMVLFLSQNGHFKYIDRIMARYTIHVHGSYHDKSVLDWYKKVTIPTLKVLEENVTSPVLAKKMYARRLQETLALNRTENNRWAYSRNLVLLMWNVRYSAFSLRDLLYLFRNFESYIEYVRK